MYLQHRVLLVGLSWASWGGCRYAREIISDTRYPAGPGKGLKGLNMGGLKI